MDLRAWLQNWRQWSGLSELQMEEQDQRKTAPRHVVREVFRVLDGAIAELRQEVAKRDETIRQRDETIEMLSRVTVDDAGRIEALEGALVYLHDEYLKPMMVQRTLIWPAELAGMYRRVAVKRRPAEVVEAISLPDLRQGEG